MTSVATTVDISRALAIGGWMSNEELLWLATHAQTHNRIVEFGSLHGRSTRALADNNKGTIYAVDPWCGAYKTDDGRVVENIDTNVYPYFYHNLKDHIDKGHVVPVRGFSYNLSLPDCVDMVFIDGDHRYETVVKDIKKAIELTKPGGLISGHDYGHLQWPGVNRAVDEIFGDNVRLLEGTFIWWTLKS